MKNLNKFSKKLKVLVVDDDEEARKQIVKLLENFFDNITIGVDGVDGLEKFIDQTFDLVISDISMPKMDGIKMVTKIREINNEISIILLSAHSDENNLMNSIKLGVNGYILKPIDLVQFIETISRAIKNIQLKEQNRQYKKELENINSMLEIQVNERTLEVIALNKEIQDTQREVVFTMGAIGERRSQETGNHVKRVAEYSKIFALSYGLSEEDAEMLKQASPMHDIGKVAIPDYILNKPARLTKEEFTIMKNHAELGFEMLKASSRPLLKLAATIAHEHHEKYDGTGYPQGLNGNDININARITAIADVFDALGSSRVYKKAWEDEDIFNLLKQERGKHFDPVLVDIFFDNLQEFLSIRNRFKD